ncbi:sensor histidine kinase [Chitinophaga sedimenti]|uniref:sensor histidine kinase n=1 Tax=Chitinophaga sedimenti TaxID=2033606 RepID=UPI0020029D3B|nr:histidine kinase [Chitinophaga sedimenti]MCK7559193.1 sensor histidine kinase [Chitinophaga sedimenti]
MTQTQQQRLSAILLFLMVLLVDFYLNISVDLQFSIWGVGYTIIKLAVFYINYQWLHPRLLTKKKYAWWVLGVVALVLGAISLRYLVEEILYLRWFGYHNYFDGTTLGFYYKDNYLRFGTWVIVGSVIRFTQQWFVLREQQRELEKQRLTAEVSFLKSQINPHFLFNTLNSIYSLSYQHNEKAPEAILKLSEIMRYMLYDTEDKQAPLDKEIRYLHNFVELQKLRFNNNMYADILVEGEVAGQLIAPLLLIAFVENAFKHGVLDDPNDPVMIQLTVNGLQLQLYVQNRINHHVKDQTGGIGIANIKRRLALLYPGKHTLHIENKDDYYICELNLQLA